MAENKLKYNTSRASEREWDETTNRMGGFNSGNLDEDMDFPITGSRARWNKSAGYAPESGFPDANFHPNFGNGYGMNSNPFGTPYGTPYGTPFGAQFTNTPFNTFSNLPFNTMNTPYNAMNTPFGYNRNAYGMPLTNGMHQSNMFNGTPLTGKSFETASLYNTPWQTQNGNSWPTGTPYGSIYTHAQAPFTNTWVPGLPNLSTNGSPYSSLQGTWGTTTPMAQGFMPMNTQLPSASMLNKGKGPKGYQRSDESITENICNLLCDDLCVDATDIEVVVENCEVTLIGTVESREVKRYVEDLCEMVSGVCNVENRLRINSEKLQSKSTSSTTESKTKRSTLTTASVS